MPQEHNYCCFAQSRRNDLDKRNRPLTSNYNSVSRGFVIVSKHLFTSCISVVVSFPRASIARGEHESAERNGRLAGRVGNLYLISRTIIKLLFLLMKKGVSLSLCLSLLFCSYKPVSTGHILAPLKDAYLELFRQTFPKEKNATFLGHVQVIMQHSSWLGKSIL